MTSEKLKPGEAMTLYNADGTIFGYAFEPTEEERKATEAWLVPNLEPASSTPKWETKF